MTNKPVRTGDLSYLTPFAKEDTSLDSLKEYRVLARASIVQSMSAQELKDTHGEGAVVLIPGSSLIASRGEPFNFVPVFHFTEFLKWGDRRDTANGGVLDRTFDPHSDLARRSRDEKLREEAYPDNDKWSYRYVEQIVFAGVLYGDTEHAGTPIAVAFSKGEFFQGRNFASACMQRTVNIEGEAFRAPLWSQVWEFSTRLRERSGNKWYGFDFRNPTLCDPYIAEGEAEAFRSMHTMLKEDFEAQRLRVDDTEHPTDNNTSEDDLNEF